MSDEPPDMRTDDRTECDITLHLVEEECQRLEAENARLREALREATYAGYSAEHWCGAYELLRDAVVGQLSQDEMDRLEDDIAEETIMENAIRFLGEQLHALRDVLTEFMDAYENTDEWLGKGFADAAHHARAALASTEATS